MARDNIFPLLRLFGRGTRRNDEPVFAIVLTWLLIQIVLLAGDINAVAPFVTMFALMSYVIINFACFLLKVASAPNFRPTFVYFHWITGLYGFLSCLTAMFIVSTAHAALSIIFLIACWIVIHFTSTPKPWGDIQQALIYHQVRKYLLRLNQRQTHVKFWRPQILYLVNHRAESTPLIRFANALKKGSLFILANVVDTAVDDSQKLVSVVQEKAKWMDFVDQLGVKAFMEIIAAPTIRTGGRIALFNTGLGGMKPNILLLGWKKLEVVDRLSIVDYVGLISDSLALGKSVAIARGFQSLALPSHGAETVHGYWNDMVFWLRGVVGRQDRSLHRRFIDLYPLFLSSDLDTFSMVLQLGCILHMVPEWSERYFRLRVICTVESESQIADEAKRMEQLLDDLRICARVVCVSLESSGLLSHSQFPNVSSGQQDFDMHDLTIPASSNSFFAAMNPLDQARVMNRLMHTLSPPSQTIVLFTSLASPPNTTDREEMKISDYWKFNSVLSDGAGGEASEGVLNGEGLPPVLMIHGKGTVLTTSL